MCSLHHDGRKRIAGFNPLDEVPKADPSQGRLTSSKLDLEASAVDSIQDIRLRKLLQLIEADPLGTIHDWALAFNLSHSHLQHLFKQATGIGLGHVLTEKRLQRAAQLLANTNMSVKEIAFAVGYEHTSSFTRAFERRFEQGPRRYRRQNAA